MIHKKVYGAPTNGSIILVHGLGSHSGRYSKLINLFNKLGFAVFTFDWPGHGKSMGKRGHTRIQDGINEIQQINESIQGKPFLFGHSLGGLTVLRYAELYPNTIRGVIVSSPALARNVHMTDAKMLIARIMGRITPMVTVYNHLDPNDMSRNDVAVQNYRDDPLVHDRISAALTRSLFLTMKQVHQDAGKIQVPILILTGTNDSIVPISGARSFIQAVTVKDKTLKEFADAFHEIIEDPEHSNAFYQMIISWINKH